LHGIADGACPMRTELLGVAINTNSVAAGGDLEKFPRECIGNTDATVGGGNAREVSGMYGNPFPVEPLHVGHRGPIIEAGMMLNAFLKNVERSVRRGLTPS